MKKSQICMLVFGLLLLLNSEFAHAQTKWSSFQNGGQLVADQPRLPLTWEPETVAWKTPLAGYGQSSPVVFGDLAYVCSVTGPNKDTLNVQAFSTETGDSQWIFEHPNSSPEKNNVMTSRAAPTPAVDENGVFVFFESGNICALDHQGNVRWKRDLKQEFGDFKVRHGLAASLEQNRSNIFLWAERSESPFVMAIDKASGETVWKKVGLGKTSWSSPRLVPVGNEHHLVLSATELIVGIDPKNGERLWQFENVSGNTSSTPIPIEDGKFLLGSNGRGGAKAVPSCGVIQIELVDDKFSASWLWTAPKASCSFGSPLAFNGRGYFVDRTGIVHCHDLKTGDKIFIGRLPSGSIWATPLASEEGLYFFGKNGTTSVIETGANFKTIAKNDLWMPNQTKKEDQTEGEEPDVGTTSVLYAAASANSMLLLRRGDILYCVKRQSPKLPTQ